MHVYLIKFFISIHTIVLRQDLANSVILHTLVILLFHSSAIHIMFVRALLPVPNRHVCLLKRRVAGKNGEERKIGLY